MRKVALRFLAATVFCAASGSVLAYPTTDRMFPGTTEESSLTSNVTRSFQFGTDQGSDLSPQMNRAAGGQSGFTPRAAAAAPAPARPVDPRFNSDFYGAR